MEASTATASNPSTGPASRPGRLHALDGLRASMMLLGIVIHGVLPYLPDPESKMPFHDAQAASLAYLLVILFIHTFRMPIFFVMAGFFAAMTRDRRGAGGLLRDRFRRIVVPFAVGWALCFPAMKATNAYFRAGGGLAGMSRAFDDLVGGRLYAEPDLSYFWFLYYLAMFYPIGLATSWLVRRLGPTTGEGLDRAFAAALRSPARPVLFAIPTAAALWPMGTGTFDTVTTFLPSPALLAGYGVFFAFGWLLHAHAGLLPTFGRHAWKQVGLAVLLWPLNLGAGFLFAAARPVHDVPMHAATVLTTALIAWLFIFGITGLFVRHLSRPSPSMRYLTDASYWCYLVHVPIIYWVAALIAPLSLASPLKVLLLMALALTAALAAYHFAVRSTFLGEHLNGRRYPRRLPWRELAEGGGAS